MNSGTEHTYNIGDAVLVDVNGAQVPGVIESGESGSFVVQLSGDWAGDAGGSSSSMTVNAEQLSPVLGSAAGGNAELPG